MLVECSFFIPVLGHDMQHWEWLHDCIAKFGGGSRSESTWLGGYTEPGGKVVMDESYEYKVAVPVDQGVDDLRDMLRHACYRFRQQCIYLSVAGTVEFIARSDHVDKE